METINDRNRYGPVEPWAQFAFTNFPEGRRYADFLTGFFATAKLSMDAIGRLAQDTLYFHEGPTAPIPQDRQNYDYRMSIPAGNQQDGAVGGHASPVSSTRSQYQSVLSRPAVKSQCVPYHVGTHCQRRQFQAAARTGDVSGEDRGCNLSLARSSRLQMNNLRDRLSVAFNSFFSDVYVPPPSDREISLARYISGKGRPPEEAFTTLQLVLKPGETLQTGAGKSITVGQPAGPGAGSDWRMDPAPWLDYVRGSGGSSGVARTSV